MKSVNDLEVVRELDALHRELSRMSVSKRLGNPSALKTEDLFKAHPLPTDQETIDHLNEELLSVQDEEAKRRLQRLVYGCMDLALDQETSSLADMLNFYHEHCSMCVGPEKIPALEIVPWLQSQSDFDKREKMGDECRIYFKTIVNPVLTGMLELTVRAVRERFGYAHYVRYAEARRNVSFDDLAGRFREYLDDTKEVYFNRITPWVERKIGRPMGELSRYHALYLARINRFDDLFPVQRLESLVHSTFAGLGFDFKKRRDVAVDIAKSGSKNPDGVCVGEEIPGKIHVLMKPIGGLIDVETLLHEMGHAFFLSYFDAALPIEYRRIYQTPALDEAFAFLFMELFMNPRWLSEMVDAPDATAEELSQLYWTKRLCLVRRYMGKFLAEKELHERNKITDSEPYRQSMALATGFVYSPQDYLVDMEPDFYALDYLNAWAGADVLRNHLEENFGENWYSDRRAGDFLKNIAKDGRRYTLEEVLLEHCGRELGVPERPRD